MKLKFLIVALALVFPFLGNAQSADSNLPQNWQHLDKVKDGIMGVSTDKVYSELLKGKKSETVIVAVIDGGVDPLHEDLKDVMWTNPGEIPGNGMDDDKNGYVDDVYGWNFIGGKDGKNVHHDQLEITRLYAKYRQKFKDVDPASLSKKDKKLYDKYKKMEETIDEERGSAKENAAFYGGLMDAVDKLIEAMGTDEFSANDLQKFESDDQLVSRAAQIMTGILADGGTVKGFKDQLQGGIDYFSAQAEYYYNPDIDPRPIVGDNYADSYEKHYGNNDVKGPDAGHGTHVAGIIAASRSNGVGMDGVADNVKIMALRCVPDGDERDKDVANSIIYAVDNGATVINMSFGKGYSWDKGVVDKAVKYAKKHDVLLVHAAGNSSQNNDEDDNFPNDIYAKKGLFGPKKAKHWLEIGALSWKGGEDAPASFSNYGKENVDLFAPGVDIYSTMPDGDYAPMSGTSMASPVAAGVAALIRSYYPELSAEQVKEVLMSTTVASKDMQEVKLPGGDGKMVPFSDLSVTGGTVSAYEAVKKAGSLKGKRKKKARKNAAAAAAAANGKKIKKKGQA